VSTVIKPRTPAGSEPSRDEDPTGVRALLSSLPEPDPMPGHVVDRINASLAAEQAERATKTSETSVTPLLSRVRRRPARVLFATAGAAAAAVLIAALGSTLTSLQPQSDTSATAARPAAPRAAAPSVADPTSGSAQGLERTGGTAPAAGDPAAAAGPAPANTDAQVQLRQSEVDYTRASFVTQARNLAQAEQFALADRIPPKAAASEGAKVAEGAGTAAGLPGCLRAIGADRAQVVQADVSTYEGKPAVVIVATTNGRTVAYAVEPRCGPAGAFLLHPAITVP
jgi:hypothetical protein